MNKLTNFGNKVNEILLDKVIDTGCRCFIALANYYKSFTVPKWRSTTLSTVSF